VNKLIAALLLAAPLCAVGADPALEQRAQAIEEQLRCLVCQNQTIADSNAGLAVDLRRQVREQLAQGKSEREVTDFMVQRYGDFVLYRPPVKSTTWLLWFGPFALLAAGLGLLALKLKRRAGEAESEPDLAPEDLQRARSLLKDPE
jgi:cytochrome c-type biogenesis protein CcmH